MPHAYYLAGDSYPRDLPAETALADRLERAGIEVVRHHRLAALAGLPRLPTDLPGRIAALSRAISEMQRPQSPFLIGRSSGARVATVAAARLPVAGVVCLGYPFRVPGRLLEPARFVHLAGLCTPTLIFQGERDPYGGRKLTQDFLLSPAISLHFVSGGHRLELDETEWDALALRVERFMTGRPLPPSADRFDEAFYLERHPDVAAEVAEGRVGSGAEHYERLGREEGRMYRLAAR